MDVSPARKPGLASLLWVSTGISGAAAGSILVAALTRSAVIPPTSARNIAPIFPETCDSLKLKFDGQKWLTKWLTNQMKTGSSNSDTICLNLLQNHTKSLVVRPQRRTIPTLASNLDFNQWNQWFCDFYTVLDRVTANVHC